MRHSLGRALRSALSWSFIATTLRFASGILLLPLMLRRIPPDELGLWYVFVSLGALAALLDLGFAPTVVRSAGYLWAGSPVLIPFGVELADPAIAQSSTLPRANLPKLGALLASLRVYYSAVSAIVFLLLIAIGGAWIWQRSAAMVNASSIRLAFCVYALGVALTFANSLWPSLLLGINAVRQAQQIMAACLFGNLALAAIGLLLGWGIWALVIGTVVGGIAERLIGRGVFRRIVTLPRGRFDPAVIRVLWPNAWRTGAVGLGAFLTVQANTIICSACLGLTTTASYGLTLQAVLFLAGVSSVWVTVELPAINQLRAHGRLERIAVIFRSRIVFALLTFLLGGLVLLSLGEPLLHLMGAQTQLLPHALLATLLAIQLLEMHHSLYALLVITENLNPFLEPSLISGTAIAMLSLWLTPRLGVWGMLIAAGAVQLCFNNWWPIVRALRGLGPAGRDYWRGFFRLA